MSARDPFDLDAATMRRLGYRVVDALVDRIGGLDREPAWRTASRAELEARLAGPAPETGRDFETVLDCLLETVLPFAARVDHPRFLAYVPGSPTWPGVLTDFLAAGHNIFQGTWLGAAGASQVELIVLEWFREWIGMPPGTAGLFLSGGSAANLTALACARSERAEPAAVAAVAYLSAESHSSVERAARIVGFDPSRIRVLAVDRHHRLSVTALHSEVQRDSSEGRTPLVVIATAGSTSTGAVDPLVDLADFCGEHGIWLHVDAAYGGFAILTGRGRDLLRGLERADSITLDPHKWLYQPFEAGCLLVREGAALERTFRILPHYLQDASATTGIVRRRDDPAAPGPPPINFADRGFQLTRSARALKVWASIQTFGLDAFRRTIDRCFDLAVHAQRRIERSPAFELLSAATLGVVCFRRRDGEPVNEERLEGLNRDLVEKLAASGVGLISSTRVAGRYALRLCILNHGTRIEDVDSVLDFLENEPVAQARATSR